MTRSPAPLPASPAAPATLFTIGYEKRDLAAYVDLLVAARVGVLVDVRQTAWSYKPGFSKTPLRQAVEQAGIAYEHAAFAGNPKALRASAPTHGACLSAYGRHLDANPGVLEQLDALLAEHSAAGRAACLTCFERHPGDCHRGILAARWVAAVPARRASTHLEPAGCPRLVDPADAAGDVGGTPVLAAAGGRMPHGARIRAGRRDARLRAAHPAADQMPLW